MQLKQLQGLAFDCQATSADPEKGFLLEMAYKVFGVSQEPPMTRFLAEQLSTAHWFDISAARRDLGYAPLVSMEEGLERLRRSFLSS